MEVARNQNQKLEVKFRHLRARAELGPSASQSITCGVYLSHI